MGLIIRHFDVGFGLFFTVLESFEIFDAFNYQVDRGGF
jgi:hypothetical protein